MLKIYITEGNQCPFIKQIMALYCINVNQYQLELEKIKSELDTQQHCRNN